MTRVWRSLDRSVASPCYICRFQSLGGFAAAGGWAPHALEEGVTEREGREAFAGVVAVSGRGRMESASVFPATRSDATGANGLAFWGFDGVWFLVW
jgi:hypothetical protein